MHFLTLMAQFKNEATVLKEWIEHYKWQGIEHIYLINNGSTDHYITILKPYLDAKYVTLYHESRKYRQKFNYNSVYKKIKNTTKWLAVCDIDEYWFAHNKSLIDYVRTKDEEGFTHIYSRWSQFGSSGHIVQPESIRLSFIYKKKRLALSCECKPIFKTEYSDGMKTVYKAFENTGSKVLNNDLTLQLNHYRVMSREYFKKIKMTRGDACSLSSQINNPRDWHYFLMNDFNDRLDLTLKNMVLNNNYSLV